MNHNFEILAPAGSFDILKAVVKAGADAVYVGGSMFGARAYANNFTEEEMLAAIDYCHLRNVKLYMTVNTLMKGKELEQDLIPYLTPYYKQGLDAVIVQDIGALSLIHKAFPDLELHASTQMTVHGLESAQLLKELGASRVVTSREMTLKEIEVIKDKLDIEIETFVHGALCYSFSGQCLFSSMLGGRSGNRGRCAQPCRLSYSVLDHNHKLLENDSYILSLKDNCALDLLKELDEAGVYSLKIEGRMKQAEYAAGVVSYYRKYVDLYLESNKNTVSASDMKDITNLGNRCGFTKHYFSMNNHRDMITRTKPSHEKSDEALQNKIREAYVNGSDLLPIEAYVTAHIGKPLSITFQAGDVVVTKEGQEVLAAEKRPLEKADLEKAIGKLGDMDFFVDHIEIDLDEGAFLPVNAMKSLRREILSQVKEILIGNNRREVIGLNQDIYVAYDKAAICEKATTYIVSIENRALLKPLLNQSFVQIIYLDLQAYDRNSIVSDLKEDLESIKASKKEAGIILPHLFRKNTSEYFRTIIDELAALSFDYVLVRNYEELYFAKSYMTNKTIIADHSIYSFNNTAEGLLRELGASYTTVPLELNQKEIAHRNNAFSEIMIYGYYPLMITANCITKNTTGCSKLSDWRYLKDRYNKEFPVMNYCKDCYNVIYNSLPTSLLDVQNELNQMNLYRFRLHFGKESVEEMLSVLKACKNKEKVSFETTKGHYKRGVE